MNRIAKTVALACCVVSAAGALAPAAAVASDLSILASRMGDDVVNLMPRQQARSLAQNASAATGTWVTFASESSSRITQTSEYRIASEPNADGSITVDLRTTLTCVNANYAMWSTTKTIYCDGKQVAYIGPDYTVAGPGASISQQARFTISGGGTHHITSVEEDFRGGTEVSTGWDFTVDVPYVITATAGAGGTIEPAGARYVYPGTDQTYRITAEPGYRIRDLNVDGQDQGAVSIYTFPSVTSDHQITASFQKVWTVTFVDGVTGTELDRIIVDDGAATEPPRAPEHEGYRFTGWSHPTDRIDQDVDIVATYIKTHTVVFLDADGNELSRQTVDEGDGAQDPGIPERAGYTAVGWDTSFDHVDSDLTIRPLYDAQINVEVPALLPCVLTASGEVIAPTGYEISNRSPVAVRITDIQITNRQTDAPLELADTSGTVWSSDGSLRTCIIGAWETEGFTWHIGTLDRADDAELIARAAQGATSLATVAFTFEEA